MDVASFLHEELKKIDAKILATSTIDLRPLTFTFPKLDLISLARAAATERIMYFESKEHTIKVLGLGVSQALGHEAARRMLEDPLTSLFYLGHFEQNDKLHEIILPEWTFFQRDDITTLTIRASADFQSFSPCNLLFNQDVWESFRPVWISYEEEPEHDEWEKMIERSKQLFNHNILKKIVLSRKKIFKFDESLEHLKFFEDFYLSNKSSSHFTLFHQRSAQSSFLSFTPEKLFSLKGKKLETLALAGSVPRGENDNEDLIRQKELTQSAKLTQEQDAVTEEIVSLLSSVATDVSVSPLKIMKLPYIFHRQKDITAILNDDCDALDLIKLLHPTPAVGGHPRTQALEAIATIEQNMRGPYAAPFGILTKDFSEVAVAIRSVIMDEAMITVFGGAGIVDGSLAEEEWNETGLKMKPFLKVINQD